MAHFDVALAQDLHLMLDQRHGVAASMGDAHRCQQFFMFDEEVRVSLQISGHRCGIRMTGGFVGLWGWNLWLVGHGFYSLKDEQIGRASCRERGCQYV